MLVSKVAKLQREKSSEVLPAGCAGHFTKRRSKPVSAMTRPDNSMNNLWIHFAAGFRHKVSVIAARIRELQRMNPAHSATRSRVEICSQEGWGKAVEWQHYRQWKQTRGDWTNGTQTSTTPDLLCLTTNAQCITGRCVDVSWNWQMDKTPAEANSPCVYNSAMNFQNSYTVMCPAPWRGTLLRWHVEITDLNWQCMYFSIVEKYNLRNECASEGSVSEINQKCIRNLQIQQDLFIHVRLAFSDSRQVSIQSINEALFWDIKSKLSSCSSERSWRLDWLDSSENQSFVFCLCAKEE